MLAQTCPDFELIALDGGCMAGDQPNRAPALYVSFRRRSSSASLGSGDAKLPVFTAPSGT